MKKTIIFLLVTLMFFAACTPAASQNGSPQPTAELDEVPTEEPAQTDNSEETAEPVETPEPTETEETASPTPEPEAYKPRDEFEQLIYDCFECVNNKDYYGMADYFESFTDYEVAYITENHCGFADGAYYEVENIHEVDVEYANGTLLNLVRYGCVKFNEPMPDYLMDDSLVKAFFVCIKKGYSNLAFGDYYAHVDYLGILVNVDGQWLIYEFPSWYNNESDPDPHEIYKNTDE